MTNRESEPSPLVAAVLVVVCTVVLPCIAAAALIFACLVSQ